jgi:hypothetical protein
MKPLAFIAILSLFGKPPSENRIYYRHLAWSDYRGAVPADRPLVAAETCVQMELETDPVGDKYYYRVLAYVLPDSSFVRVREDRILRHEQTHFKIACIEALKCKQALTRLQGKDSSSEAPASALYNYYFDEASSRHDQFDQETNNSNIPEAEKRWEEKISRELHTFETALPRFPSQKKPR